MSSSRARFLSISRLGSSVTAQGRQDSNLQPPVLETGALPIEPRPYRLSSCSYTVLLSTLDAGWRSRRRRRPRPRRASLRGRHPARPARPTQGGPSDLIAASRVPVETKADNCARRLGRWRAWEPRISDRIAAIAESATLAVDAKAKALKAAGRPVIGFGAGEPDFPTPGLHRRGRRRRRPRPEDTTTTRPVGGPARAAEAIAAKTARDSGYEVDAAQVLVTNGGKQAVYNAFATLLDPGDEVLLHRAVLDDLPRGDQAGRRRAGRGRHRRDDRLPGHGRAARGRPDAADQGAAVRLAVQPDRRGLPARAGRGDRRAGRPSTACGWSPTRSTSTSSTATPSMSSIADRRARAGDRSSSLNGVAKTYAMTGWRVGWMIGPADVVKAATNLQSHPPPTSQRLPGGRARRGHRRPVRGRRDARGVRPAPQDDRVDAVARSRASSAPSRRARSTPTRR